MQILIIGDTLSACALAQQLTEEQHSVRIIGMHSARLQALQQYADLEVIQQDPNNAQSYYPLQQELFNTIICLQQDDCHNLVSAQLASHILQPEVIICSLHHHDPVLASLLRQATVNSVIFSPHQLCAQALTALLHYPGCLEVIRLSNYPVVHTRIQPQCTFIANTCAQINQYSPTWQVLAHHRDNEILDIDHHNLIEAGDDIIIALYTNKQSLYQQLNPGLKAYRDIIIAGSSDISIQFIERLPRHCHAKIINANPKHNQHIAQAFPQHTILQGNINDTALLLHENIANAQAFFALSNDDEDNLVSALQAKNLQAHLVASLVNRPSLVPIVEQSKIDIALSPQRIITDTIFRYVHRQNVHAAHALQQHCGEIIEIKIDATLAQRQLNHISLPKHCHWFGLQRHGKISAMNPQTTLQQGDQCSLYISQASDVNGIIEQLYPND